jgi:hypothetical protein
MNTLSLVPSRKHPLAYMVATALGVTSLTGLTIPVYADSTDTVCYAVADNDRYGDADVLVRMQVNGTTTEIGTQGTGTQYIEAVTFDIKGETLYAVDGGQFGTLNLESGEFTPIGEGIGTGRGVDGEVELNDIDGLTADQAADGLIYATHRREHQSSPQYDLLFQVNVYTGQIVANAFGEGVDYVPVTIAGLPEFYDVDDIASDPESGQLYIIANTGDGVRSVLAYLEKDGGVPTGNAIYIGENVDDIESLTFSSEPEPDGSYKLYGTTGGGGANKDADPTNRNRLYEISKLTGAASPQGELLPPEGAPQRDYEAVSCRTEEPVAGTCVMYAIHDEGARDSQIIEIDPFAGNGVGAVKPLGPLYVNYDIEGLALLPTNGKLYGTSGSDQARGVPDGALYEINRENGAIHLIGETGYSEVSGFAMRPSDNTLWGWARGGNRRQKTPSGPIIIDPDTGVGTLVKEFPFQDPDIQATAWSPEGDKLYAVVVNDEVLPYGTNLWVYDPETQELTEKCTQVAGSLEVEGMEMQPNGVLLLAAHQRTDVGIVAYDPETCSIEATRTFKNVKSYYDIESIEWPAKECDYRSWLYPGSGDVEIDLQQYEMVPADVEEAILQALGNAEDISVESHAGEVTVYIGNQTFVARPSIYGDSGTRKVRKEGAEVTAAEIVDVEEEGITKKVLSFSTSDGTTESWVLNPSIRDEESLTKALDDVGDSEIEDDGVVRLTLADGSEMCGVLSLEKVPADVPEGEALELPETDTSTVLAIGDFDEDGQADYLIVSPTDEQQLLYGITCPNKD